MGATVSEERRIMECVVSCVFSASDSVFRDKIVVSTEMLNSEKLFTLNYIICIIPLTPYQIMLGDPVEEDEMGRACSTLGEKLNSSGFWWGGLKERDLLGDLTKGRPGGVGNRFSSFYY
jgi:hypothetical protein